MEGFKDVLVVMDDSARNTALLGLAVRVASRYGAHLVGLYVDQPYVIPGYVQLEVAAGLGGVAAAPLPEAAETGDALRESLSLAQPRREARERARALFYQHAAIAGITTEWRVREGIPSEVAIQHGHYSDMVIVGQAGPTLTGELPEYVLLGGGRPILVVPYAGTFPTVGERVLVAWNGSREATRAVHDALPFLQSAAHVTALTITHRHGLGGDGEVPGADLAWHLSRHGVKAEASGLTAEDVAVAPMLLSRIADLQADLLVMGGYGHSRMREIILGGVTREILKSLTVPTVLSH
jgi:nucleotide-binding universal stress UspA family protein